MMCASALVAPAPLTLVSELTTTVALMLVVCLFEISNANTIDVVLDGVVYRVVGLLESVATPDFVTNLKVFAIDYPKANAKATTVSSETPEVVIVVLVTDVNLPFASTARTGTWVAEP